MNKAVLLCGGSGSRLMPLTKVTNKALLPVYNKPMVYHAIHFLVESGIRDILIVCGGNSLGEFLPLIGNGEDFGLESITYRVQREPKGIADALSLAKEWSNNESICLMLSDNIFENDIKEHVSQFIDGCYIFLTTVSNPQDYGVATLDADNKSIINIIEKPKTPQSNKIVTGIYLYDNTVWNKLESLTVSERGELEITDINNLYLKEKAVQAFDLNGWWSDCGENLNVYFNACKLMHDKFQSQSQSQSL